MWLDDQLTAAARQSVWEVGLGVVVIPRLLPWRYLYYHHLAKPAEPWR